MINPTVHPVWPIPAIVDTLADGRNVVDVRGLPDAPHPFVELTDAEFLALLDQREQLIVWSQPGEKGDPLRYGCELPQWTDADRLLDPEILANLSHKEIGRIWKAHCLVNGYDYHEHIAIGRELEVLGKLPASFMLFPPVSRNADVWTNIARMRVLNSEQSKCNQENHVCPLQLDVVERLIQRYSNSGEVVCDPFGGIGTVPHMAIKMGRQGWMTELNAEYWRCAVGYCEQAEAEQTMPTLFDLLKEPEPVEAVA